MRRFHICWSRYWLIKVVQCLRKMGEVSLLRNVWIILDQKFQSRKWWRGCKPILSESISASDWFVWLNAVGSSGEVNRNDMLSQNSKYGWTKKFCAAAIFTWVVVIVLCIAVKNRSLRRSKYYHKRFDLHRDCTNPEDECVQMQILYGDNFFIWLHRFCVLSHLFSMDFMPHISLRIQHLRYRLNEYVAQ